MNTYANSLVCWASGSLGFLFVIVEVIFFVVEFMWYPMCFTNFEFGIRRFTFLFLWAPSLKVFSFKFSEVDMFEISLFDF